MWHIDAGLYAKPEPGRKLSEAGSMPQITIFCLPQNCSRKFADTSALLGDLPDKLQEDKGWGVGLNVLKTSLFATLPDLTYTNHAGKECIVIGMHVQPYDKKPSGSSRG